MDVLIIMLILCCGVTMAAVCDLKSGKIPNVLTLSMILVGLAYHTMTTGLSGLWFSAGGLLLGTGVFFILYLMGGMGAGDAKLLGAVGSIVGPKGVVIAGLLSVLLGLVYALVLLLIRRDYCRSFVRRIWMTFKTLFLTGQLIVIPPKIEEKQLILRYAVPIAIGTMSYVVLKITGSSIIQDFLGLQFSI